jgi:lysophospholipase L1-like esterase
MTGDPVTLDYNAPTAVGGVAPVTVTCDPPSHSAFPVGTTPVSCRAQDNTGTSRTCSFSALVKPPPRLSGTRFLAFGDSLTEGTTAPGLVVSRPDSYPFKLKLLLEDRYRTQSFEIINEGEPGEQATEGVLRLGAALQRHHPDVMLLMEGSNDLTLQRGLAIQRALPALEKMVTDAQDRGVKVCLATIPPQRAGGSRDQVAGLIPAFNDEIRAMAMRRNAVLVDVYAAVIQDMSLIGNDDLHPTGRGYTVIAETFFTAIRGAFEER